MMKMLRSKKGLDYAAVMVIVVVVLVIYLFIRLSAKLEPFEVRIGEYQVALLEAYQQGENALLFVDQAAKFSAYKALDTLAQRGGMKSDDCGTIIEKGRKIYAWTKHGADCTDSVQPYDAFGELMNGQMAVYLAKYRGAILPLNNYEIFVQDNSVTGTAIMPAIVLVQPPPKMIMAKFIGITIPWTTVQMPMAPVGEYDFKPSFTVNISTKISAYALLKKEVRAFYDCVNAYSPDECAKSSFALLTVSRSADNPDYLIAAANNPAKNPYGTMSDIVFALYAPQ
ncbi:MAG: hypothetical protein QXK08_00535 [Candidatus Woesearchaeota archaeon]